MLYIIKIIRIIFLKIRIKYNSKLFYKHNIVGWR
jgi:hypothetical protein